MSGEMELDPKALELAAEASWNALHPGLRQTAYDRVDSIISTTAAITAYLSAAGLVSVPVIGRKG